MREDGALDYDSNMWLRDANGFSIYFGKRAREFSDALVVCSESEGVAPKTLGLRKYKRKDCKEAEQMGPSSFSWTLCLL